MEHLTMDQVKKAILEYVDEPSYNYALLIDGEWGCGKTYFIKKTVIPEIEKIKIEPKGKRTNRNKKSETNDDNKKVIYVSLYGVRSTDDISQQILHAWIETNAGSKSGIVGKLLPGVKITLETVGSFFGRSETTKKAEELASLFITNWDKYVLIFDDLERTYLHINEVFGFINQFVEQNEAKVILVANEKEIGGVGMQKNLEQKYLVCLHDNIQYPDFNDEFVQGMNESDSEQSDPQDENKISEKMTVDDLNKRVDHVFGELDQYKKIKEKLIGKTIFFKPDLEKLIRQITLDVKDATVRQTIEQTVPIMVSIMQREAHYNLRTYQFAMAFMVKVFLLLNSAQIDYQKFEFAKTLVRATLITSIAYKKGEKAIDWLYEAEYGDFTRTGKEMWEDSYTTFKFISDYIYYSAYDESKFTDIINEYLEDKKLESLHESSAFNKLQNYWIMEDEDIEVQLENIKKEICQEDEYYIERYALLLSKLYGLIAIGFHITIETYINLMIKTITKHGSFPRSRIQPSPIENDELHDKFMNYLSFLYGLDDQTTENSYINQLDSILTSEKGWGENLYSYSIQNIEAIYSMGRFLSLVNIKLLVSRINSGSTKDMFNFYSCLKGVYSQTGILESVEEEDHLKDLYFRIRHMKSRSKTKESLRKEIVGFLLKIIKKMDRIIELKNEDIPLS